MNQVSFYFILLLKIADFVVIKIETKRKSHLFLELFNCTISHLTNVRVRALQVKNIAYFYFLADTPR